MKRELDQKGEAFIAELKERYAIKKAKSIAEVYDDNPDIDRVCIFQYARKVLKTDVKSLFEAEGIIASNNNSLEDGKSGSKKTNKKVEICVQEPYENFNIKWAIEERDKRRQNLKKKTPSETGNTNRQKPWDKYEAALLLEAYIKVNDGKITRKAAISSVSNDLRKRAEALGETVDDVFRNEAGITFQMFSMESAYLGYTIKKPATKLFTEMVRMRENNWEEYNEILRELNVLPDAKTSLEDTFITWLSNKVSPAQLSELYIVVSLIDEFCMLKKILMKPLFETTDLKALTNVKETIERDKTFRHRYRRQVNRMHSIIRHYISFIEEQNDESRHLIETTEYANTKEHETKTIDRNEQNTQELFFASYFSKKLQNVFGECCISNLEKVAAAVPEPSGIGTDHCIHFLLSYSV